VPADNGGPARPGWLDTSAFLLQSAELARGLGADAQDSEVATVARSGLAERNTAGIALLREARPGDAVVALDGVVADCEVALGPQDPDTLIAAGNRAVAHAWAGQSAEAILQIEKNLTERAQVFGERHPRTLDALDALGTGLRMAGRPAEAAPTHALAAEHRAHVLGTGHPDTLVSRLGLALDLADAGSLDRAAEELDRLLHADIPLGSRHPVTTAVRIAAADVALALGWVDHAVTQLQLALAATESTYGGAHPTAVALRAELDAVAAERGAQPG
jgi:hypothetical protein